MELAEAIKKSTPLKIVLPFRAKPLEREDRCVAEMFMIDTKAGAAVVWLEPYWPAHPDRRVCQICYADPVEKDATSWVDNRPRFGPFCIPYQSPFLVEQLTAESSLWRPFLDWHSWRHARRSQCLRSKAWERVMTELAEVEPCRRV